MIRGMLKMANAIKTNTSNVTVSLILPGGISYGDYTRYYLHIVSLVEELKKENGKND
jgi:phosphoribosylformylglycinamidine (FGAM) synthase-like amidotransferase family enzyme